MKTTTLVLSSVLPMVLVIAGCSGQVKLGGRVTFSDDGKPLEKGVVMFDTGTFVARGVIDQQGRYVVGSIGSRDGLPPGQYKVYIADSDKTTGFKPSGFPILEPVIDSKFTNAAQTPLSIEVGSSTKTFDIEVERWKPEEK